MKQAVLSFVGVSLLLAITILSAADSATQPMLPAAATSRPASNERTTESGLKIISVSESTPVAAENDTVWVHYTGKLPDGTKFDSSYDHEDKAPLEFQVGTPRLIKGWNEGILGMKLGEKRQLIIPPNLGYGEKGNGRIPPNATLIFDMELVGLKKAS